MEGGQNNNISLESGLDVHSSEMLVPANQPLFQHNRQRFQGKYLPSSLRFEKDGWAAGEDVYNFDIISHSIAVGNYTISRSTYATYSSYTIYELKVYDSDNIQVGTIRLINKSSILSHTCDSCTLSSTTAPDPTITAVINDKTATLNYDSLTHELTLSDDSDSDITLDSYSLSRSNVLTATLTDTANTVALAFAGLYKPSSTVTNGSYSLGKFSSYADGVCVWTSGKSTVTYDATAKTITFEYGGEVYATASNVSLDGAGYWDVSFQVDVSFTDTTAVALSEFFPFFNNLQLTTLYTVVSTQADSSYTFNNWSTSMYDPVNTASNIATLLYKNLPAYNDDDNSAYNEQYIVQTMPVWAGVSVQQAAYSVKNLSVVTDTGSVIGSDELSDIGPYYFFSYANYADESLVSIGVDVVTSGFVTTVPTAPSSPVSMTTQNASVVFYATEDLKQYSGYCHTFGLQIWEHCIDIASECGYDSTELSAKLSYTAKVTFKYVVATKYSVSSKVSYDEDTDESTITYTYLYTLSTGTDTISFTLDDTYGAIPYTTYSFSLNSDSSAYVVLDSEENVMFSVPYNAYIVPTTVTFAINSSLSTSDFTLTIGGSDCSIDISDSAFYLSGVMSVYWDISTTDFAATITNSSSNPLTFRSQISENNLGTGATYLAKLKTSTDFSDGDGFGIGYAFYGRCCQGIVASALSIKSSDLLDSTLSASDFQITAVEDLSTLDGYDKDALYINDLFTHKITQAVCSTSLTISIYLCAVYSRTYMFYYGTSISSYDTSSSSSSSTKISVMPGHIVFGNLSSVSSSYGSLSYYTISKVYTSTTVDSDYAFNISVTGTPARDDNDNYFNYISYIQSAFDNTKLISGNEFSDTYASEMQTALTWDFSSVPKFFVAPNASSSADIDQLSYHYQDITCTIDNITIAYKYDLIRDTLTFSSITGSDGTEYTVTDGTSGSFTYNNLTVTLSVGLTDGVEDDSDGISNMLFTYTAKVDYDVALTVPTLYSSAISAGWELSTYAIPDIATVLYTDPDDTSKVYKCVVNYTTSTLTVYRSTDGGSTFGSAQSATVTWYDNGTGFSLSSEDTRNITAVLYGIYTISGLSIESLSSTAIQALIDGDEESIAIDISATGLFDSTQQSKMEYTYTNVTNETLTDTKFASLLVDDEYQIIRQQWNTTVDVENYWWIDDTHVMALTKSQFILRQKASEIEDYDDVLLDDWNGDVFVDVATFNRIDYLDSSVIRYFCTSAYDGATAKFVTVSVTDNIITFNVYDPLDDMSVVSYEFEFVKQSIGTELCPDNSSIYTYSELVYYNVVSQAKWSGTCIDDNVIIGLHYDSNFNQWAFVLNGGTSYVIQGYGFVGVNGCLTGGEIPTMYFSTTKGFTGTVQSLDTIKPAEKTSSDDDVHNISALSELYAVEERIVGTDAQQWYIIKQLPSIVSHLTYSKGSFTVCELPINNNFSAVYDSGSYTKAVFSDYKFKIKSFTSVLPDTNTIFTAACALMGSPLLYYFDPKISVANYLQQTLGQAAYVHYNSTSIHQSKDVTKGSVTNNYSQEEADAAVANSLDTQAAASDEIVFDIQSIKQQLAAADAYDTVFTALAAAGISALDWGSNELVVNAASNDPAAPSTGRESKKFSTTFLQNLASMSAADMTMQSVTPVQSSEVTGVRTLDMFYSTCDRQQVQAGPGWVNHNFVAQCVSQSVTSVQAEYSQQKILFILGALSEYQLQVTNKALEAAYNATYNYMQSFSGSGVLFGGFVAGGNMTLAASMALGLACYALDVACTATRIGLDLIPKIVSALGADTLHTSVTSRLSKHNYDIEGKHKYGSKTECFMWPCFGVSAAQSITDESVECVTQNKAWKLSMYTGSTRDVLDSSQPDFVTVDSPSNSFKDDIPYYIAMVQGSQDTVTLPDDMAYVLGVPSFLPEDTYKNENISESEPVFPTAPFQDYIISAEWQIGQTSSVGMTTWISCKDTKIIDGEYSNCVISDDFCGIAAPYTALEIKRGISSSYLRPYLVTPQALALNNTGLNCCYEEKAYHAFDGYGYRVVNWCGAPGMNKEHQTWLYSFLINDRLKRSNKMPQNEYLGNFVCEPVVAIQGDYNDKVYTMITQPGEGKGLQAGTIGEDKDVRRYSIPVFSEYVSTLPAAVKTISAVTLSVIDGVTSLTTNNRDLQTAYKAPTSIDFTIGKSTYRYTQEYICSLEMQSGISVVTNLVPCLGLEYIGSTPYEAYFYSQATRQYYSYTGGTSINVVDMIERFRDVTGGYYDFVNQEVLMPCLATFMRLDKHVFDDEDETDNVIIPRLKNKQFIGEVWPPLETIYNTRSWYKVESLPCGVVYQGPNRCIISRFTLQDYMVNQIKDNYGLWKRVPREKYHPFREYKAIYETVDEQIGEEVEVKGWTHNPFLLVTAPIGTSENTDNMYEWEITFCWPIEMDQLYEQDNYAVVNVTAETMTPGGKVIAARPTHVFLTKELFTRTGNYGYYSFRYQSGCGAGNRERLHIWSDQFICISSLNVNIKPITQKRTEQLTIQPDIQNLVEL